MRIYQLPSSIIMLTVLWWWIFEALKTGQWLFCEMSVISSRHLPAKSAPAKSRHTGAQIRPRYHDGSYIVILIYFAQSSDIMLGIKRDKEMSWITRIMRAPLPSAITLPRCMWKVRGMSKAGNQLGAYGRVIEYHIVTCHITSVLPPPSSAQAPYHGWFGG